MEITKDRTELIREAADKLSIVGTGMTLEADQADALDRNVDPLCLELIRDEVCNVSDTDAIPSEWFDSLAGLLANRCAYLGGKNFDPQIKEYYESRLRRLTASGPNYATLETDYF